MRLWSVNGDLRCVSTLRYPGDNAKYEKRSQDEFIQLQLPSQRNLEDKRREKNIFGGVELDLSILDLFASSKPLFKLQAQDSSTRVDKVVVFGSFAGELHRDAFVLVQPKPLPGSSMSNSND